jgi:hypothetical protein
MDRNFKSAALADKVRAELGAQEKLIWTGHPDAGATFRKMRFLLWIGIPWTAIAGILTVFHSAGVVGLIIGAALTAGPFVNAGRARNTIYALTDSRAIIICKLAGGTTQVSVDLSGADREPEILRLEGKSGSVLFVSGLPPRRRYTDYTGKFGFWDVADADEVADVVRAVMNDPEGEWRRARAVGSGDPDRRRGSR